MTFSLMRRRITLLFAAPVALSAVTLPAVTQAQQRAEFAATKLADQDAPDRTQFCSEQHVLRRVGQPIASRSGLPVNAALMIMTLRNANGMLQSYAAEFYSQGSWDVLQIAANVRRPLQQQLGSFRISDYSVIQCNPIEFPQSPFFEELVERRSLIGFMSGAAPLTPRSRMFYYPLPQAQMAAHDPKWKPQAAEPPRTASMPERNYPNPDYPLIPPAAEIRPGQSVVAYENATCSSQGNWLLTYQGTVVSSSKEEVEVFVNRRTGLYNYVGETGPAGEKDKVWDKGYLCAPRREICFGDVDFSAWNGQITKGSPVPFPRDNIGVVDDVTKDPVPIFRHFLTRACAAGPISAIAVGASDPAASEKPAPGAETAAAPDAQAIKPSAGAAAPAPPGTPLPGKKGL